MVAGQMGFELGSKECSICFSQRPRLVAVLRKNRTQSLQSKRVWDEKVEYSASKLPNCINQKHEEVLEIGH